MATDLEEKLKEKLTGGQGISSTDVADFERPEEQHEDVKGDIQAPVPPEADKDRMVKMGADGSPGLKMDVTAETIITKGNPIFDPSVLPDEVTLTEDEREKFLEAIVTGDRFELTFSIFNGRVTGRIRSRSQKESSAIIAQLNRETNDEKLETALEYSTRMRNMMLAAQVSEMNDTKYAPLQEPLDRVNRGKDDEGKDKIDEPGWLGQIKGWEEQHEGLVGAVYRELQLFERKYWTMVQNASDQNFWNPEESTSE